MATRAGAEADGCRPGDGCAHDRIGARGGHSLGVVSQHRFDDSTLFLKRALAAEGWTDFASRRLCEVVQDR